ncbi:MAG: protein BatD [Acidobacteriia bacterium]|nr:protein BatD [Terriglobia bacterium]
MTPAERTLGHRRATWIGACLAVALTSAWSSCANGGTQDPEPAVTKTYEAAGGRLELTLDRSSLTTAESALLRLAVEADEGAAVAFPDSGDGFGEFAVVRDEEVSERLLDGGRVERVREYVLQPFLPGDYELPPLTVTLNGSDSISSEALTIPVESVLPDPETADLLDIAEPLDIPAPWWWWALGALLMAVAAVATLWWWKRRKEKLSAPRVVPPHEIALTALDALLSEGLLAGGAVELFYLRLSDIVRHYIEDQFSLRAPEQTTEEFLVAMSSGPHIRRDHQTLLRDFLQRADMVKFAKFVPAAEETGGAVEAARQFIEQSVPTGVLSAEPGSG